MDGHLNGRTNYGRQLLEHVHFDVQLCRQAGIIPTYGNILLLHHTTPLAMNFVQLSEIFQSQRLLLGIGASTVIGLNWFESEALHLVLVLS